MFSVCCIFSIFYVFCLYIFMLCSFVFFLLNLMFRFFVIHERYYNVDVFVRTKYDVTEGLDVKCWPTAGITVVVVVVIVNNSVWISSLCKEELCYLEH